MNRMIWAYKSKNNLTIKLKHGVHIAKICMHAVIPFKNKKNPFHLDWDEPLQGVKLTQFNGAITAPCTGQ